MIEAGIANIASNLPLFRNLFNNFSLSSIIRSVRSTISLQSMQSSSSRGERRGVPAGGKNEDQVDLVVHGLGKQQVQQLEALSV